MRVPFRLNRSGWFFLPLPRRLSFPDPRSLLRLDETAAPATFAESVSILGLGGTYKTTRPGRHRQSDALLVKTLAGKSPVILDVGASDGSTSLDLIAALGDRFTAYHVTDRALSVSAKVDGRGRAYFYDTTGACILMATPRFVVYPEEHGAAFWLRWMAVLLRGRIPPFDGPVSDVSLIQPRLREMARRDPRVTVRSYDIFHRWDGPTATVVKAANLLNRSYFSDDQIRLAVQNLWSALEEGGLLLVIDNRDVERSSLFAREARGFREIEHVNGGTAIAALVLSC